MADGYSVPAEMTAIGIASPGGPEALVAQRRPVPAPGEGEVLIRVAAAGVNRPDVLQRQGKYPPPPGASACGVRPGRPAGHLNGVPDDLTGGHVGKQGVGRQRHRVVVKG